MSPFIDKLTAVGLILVLAMAPLQGLVAASLTPFGIGADIDSITFAQIAEMPAETVSHDCSQLDDQQDGDCCPQVCSYGHCGVCFTALKAGFNHPLSASSEPELTHVLSDAVGWLAYPFFRPPRF